MRPVYNSLFDLIALLESNRLKITEKSLYSFFELKLGHTRTENCFSLTTKHKNILAILKNYTSKYKSIKGNEIILFELFRKLDNPYTEQIDFPQNFEIGKQEYHLTMVAAYSDYHFALFKKHMQWFLINDETCDPVDENLIPYLKGGIEPKDNPLWSVDIK